jgi:hypothetical protein
LQKNKATASLAVMSEMPLSNGTFVYTGFKPAFIIAKTTSAVEGLEFMITKDQGLIFIMMLLLMHKLQMMVALIIIYGYTF